MLSLWFFSFFFQFVGYILCHYLFEFQISWSSVYRSGALLCIIFFCHIIIIIVYDGLQKICRQTICRVLFDMNGSERTACWLLLAHIDWECCYLGRANIIRIYFQLFDSIRYIVFVCSFENPPCYYWLVSAVGVETFSTFWFDWRGRSRSESLLFQTWRASSSSFWMLHCAKMGVSPIDSRLNFHYDAIRKENESRPDELRYDFGSFKSSRFERCC